MNVVHGKYSMHVYGAFLILFMHVHVSVLLYVLIKYIFLACIYLLLYSIY